VPVASPPSLDSPCGEDDMEMHCEGGVCRLEPRKPAPTPEAAPRSAVADVVAPLPSPASVARVPDVATASPLPPRIAAVAPPSPAPPRVVADVPLPSPAAPRVAATTPPVIARASPTPPRAYTDARSVRTVAPAPAPRFETPPPSRPATLLERARLSAGRGHWGEVIRLGNEAAEAPPTADAWEMDLLVRRARTWALDGMNSAVQDALRGDTDSAARTLETVRRAMAGLPVEIDAERGQRALLRLADIARGDPDASSEADALRKTAYAEFRGTRWAVLFKAS
jgi:hypothetical protein